MLRKQKNNKARRKAKITTKPTLKDFFIPHAGNNHAPHILHPKRAVLYGSLFITTKAIVFATILLLPTQAYFLPDVLAEQERQLNELINELRASQNLPTLAASEELKSSSQSKAGDMAVHAYFSHVGPDNRGFKYFLKQAGYRYQVAGENLAMGFVAATDVMDAWQKSALHYQNLVDPNFVEMGLGLDSGTYKGKDTVFIANHFGQPLAYQQPLTANVVTPVISATPTPPAEVLGERYSADQTETALEKSNVTYNKSDSRVFWKSDGRQTTLTAKAFVTGATEKLTVTVDGHDIVLTSAADEAGIYTGSLTLDKPVDDFFNVVIDPTLTVTLPGGVVVIDTIPWYDIKVVNQTPTALYLGAHSILPSILQPIFNAERAVYVLGIIFFGLALLINILVEVKTQKPHVIIPTGLVIVLLVLLLAV